MADLCARLGVRPGVMRADGCVSVEHLLHRPGRPGPGVAGQPSSGHRRLTPSAWRASPSWSRPRCLGAVAGRMVRRGRQPVTAAGPTCCWPAAPPGEALAAGTGARRRGDARRVAGRSPPTCAACGGAASPPAPSGRPAVPRPRPRPARGGLQCRRGRARHLRDRALLTTRRSGVRGHDHRRLRGRATQGSSTCAANTAICSNTEAVWQWRRAAPLACRAAFGRRPASTSTSRSTRRRRLRLRRGIRADRVARGKRGTRASARPSRSSTATWASRPSVNNVETFAAAAHRAHGRRWWPASARRQSTGTKIHSGRRLRAARGIYEYPFGSPASRRAIDCGARDTQAVQVGGPRAPACRHEFGRRIAFEDVPTAGALHGVRPLARHVRGGAQLRALLRPRELRLLHAVPRRHRAGGAPHGQAGRRARFAPRRRRAALRARRP